MTEGAFDFFHSVAYFLDFVGFFESCSAANRVFCELPCLDQPLFSVFVLLWDPFWVDFM